MNKVEARLEILKITYRKDFQPVDNISLAEKIEAYLFKDEAKEEKPTPDKSATTPKKGGGSKAGNPDILS